MSSSKNKRPCKFNPLWLEVTDFQTWLEKDSKDDTKAYCCGCKKKFDISNMSISALRSHQKGKLHQSVHNSKEKAASTSITDFFGNQPSTSSNTAVSSNDSKKSTDITVANKDKVSSLTTISIISDDVLKAEVIWCLKAVVNHFSFNSCTDVGKTFQAFPDSQIARSFTCGATKMANMVCFGLSPYYHGILIDEIRRSDYYSVSFDECMNRVSQNEQMDILIRYWNTNCKQVKVSYLTSEFLGHATAADLMKHLKEGIKDLDPKKMIQLSMDGPNVHLKLLKDLQQDRKVNELPELLNIGSCGLHIVHGALQKGVNSSGLQIGCLLRALWQLFHDTPARREDYIHITGSSTFPLQFCQHRWVEDVKVAERALLIWPDLLKYVASIKDGKKAPKTASFLTVQCACDDPLTDSKLEFFVSVAKPLQGFLKKFQADAPMVPFLSQYLKEIILGLMSRFVKQSSLDAASTTRKLMNIDPHDKKHQVLPKNVDLGFAARQSVNKAIDRKEISELKVLDFKNQCLTFLSSTTAKIIEKSPLKYSLVQDLAALQPKEIVSKNADASSRFEKNLQILINASLMSASSCDEILTQYKTFTTESRQNHLIEFKNFNPEGNVRLDVFFEQHLNVQKFQLLWDAFKLLLTLSHGQASVERGYSVNKDLLVENMQEKTIIALRTI